MKAFKYILCLVFILGGLSSAVASGDSRLGQQTATPCNAVNGDAPAEQPVRDDGEGPRRPAPATQT